jgi:2,4-didehydro-3-deoxy-L-rhamnonate hydrolase
VFAIGLNYRDHVAETGLDLPTSPATFTKFPTCVSASFADVVLPSEAVDWEVELVVVIGIHARHVSPSNAWDHVAGVTVGQDLSAPPGTPRAIGCPHRRRRRCRHPPPSEVAVDSTR